MASKRNIAITYTFLFLVLLGACVFLALQVRQYINYKSDPLDGYASRIINAEELIQDIQKEKEISQNQTLLTFSRSRAFAPIATVIPRPTATPIPPPTPTPVVVARGWTLLNIYSDQFAVMKSFDGSKHTVSVGKEIQNAVQDQNLNFVVEQINKTQGWVKVRNSAGNTSILRVTGYGSAAPKKANPKANPPRSNIRRSVN